MANIGGIYFWTQTDVNALFAQLAALQAMHVANNKLLNQLLTQEGNQMSVLDDLTAAVTATQTVEQSAVTMIQGIAKQLSDALAANAAAASDPALAQLRDELNSSAAELGAAITANTPAAPTPAPTPST